MIFGKAHRTLEILYSHLFICLNLVLVINMWVFYEGSELGDGQSMLKYFHLKIHIKDGELLTFIIFLNRTLVTPSGYI